MEAVHSGIKGDVIDGSTDQPVQDAKVHTSIPVGSLLDNAPSYVVGYIIQKRNSWSKFNFFPCPPKSDTY